MDGFLSFALFLAVWLGTFIWLRSWLHREPQPRTARVNSTESTDLHMRRAHEDADS